MQMGKRRPLEGKGGTRGPDVVEVEFLLVTLSLSQEP